MILCFLVIKLLKWDVKSNFKKAIKIILIVIGIFFAVGFIIGFVYSTWIIETFPIQELGGRVTSYLSYIDIGLFLLPSLLLLIGIVLAIKFFFKKFPERVAEERSFSLNEEKINDVYHFLWGGWPIIFIFNYFLYTPTLFYLNVENRSRFFNGQYVLYVLSLFIHLWRIMGESFVFQGLGK